MRNFRIASKRKWLVIVFVVAFTGGGIRRVAAQESALAGRDISLAVVEDDGLKATAKDVVFTPRPVLNVERHIVKPDEKVAQLLRANGILPDAEA
ncbi:MAG: hypothetical protein QOJ76_2438, partial [Acidobacteriota bacterium]|nr:hypothetical protein [Acidobacteriota bacterium]